MTLFLFCTTLLTTSAFSAAAPQANVNVASSNNLRRRVLRSSSRTEAGCHRHTILPDYVIEDEAYIIEMPELIAEDVESSASVADVVDSSTSVADAIDSFVSVAEVVDSSASVAEDINSDASVADVVETAALVADVVNSSALVADDINSSASVADVVETAALVADVVNSSASVAEDINSDALVADVVNSSALVADVVETAALVTDFVDTAALVTDDIVLEDPVAQRLLAQHNQIRRAHGESALVWNFALAETIQTFADTCPGPRHGGSPPDNYDLGWQNLVGFVPCDSYATCSVVGQAAAAWSWYRTEELKYNYNTGECSIQSPALPCGHFQNMMSPDVIALGCGYSQCDNGDFVWCNYQNPMGWRPIPRILGASASEAKERLGNSLTGY